MTDNDRDLFRKLYNLFAAAASSINHTEARKIQRTLAAPRRESFFTVLTTAAVAATDSLPYDSVIRLTSDELDELMTRLGVFSDAAKTGAQVEFEAACQLVAVSGWVSVDRD